MLARRAMREVRTVTGPRKGRAGPAWAAAPPPVAEPGDYRDGRLPPEVLTAWVQFLRDDVADAANGLNNRLQVVDAVRREAMADPRLPDPLRDRLEGLERDLQRAMEIVRGLQRRVTSLAPDSLPPAVTAWEGGRHAAAHILLVEDDAANRTVMSRLFERFGHRVTAVSNGLEAFQVVEAQDGGVDCIVCDVQMPALGGRGFFEQIEERWPPLAARCVFVTGDYTRPETRAFLDRTGRPVIGKPFDVSELLNAVRHTLAQKAG